MPKKVPFCQNKLSCPFAQELEFSGENFDIWGVRSVFVCVRYGGPLILNSSKSIALSMMEATDSGRQVRKTKGSLVAPKASTAPPVPRVHVWLGLNTCKKY